MTTCIAPEPISVMGVNVVPFNSCSHASRYVEHSIASGRKSFCAAINPEKVHWASHDPDGRSVLHQADMGICDGVGIVLAAQFLLGRRIKRCTGIDLFLELIALAARRGWKVFLLGATPESNVGAYRRLSRMFPGLKIVGHRDGYFEASEPVIEHINASGADLVFVALGSPRQELWISRYRDRLNAAFCMGVGGSFDVVSGRARRAPGIFRRTGTEFFYRLISNPGRWRRQLSLPSFLIAMFRARLFRRRRSHA